MARTQCACVEVVGPSICAFRYRLLVRTPSNHIMYTRSGPCWWPGRGRLGCCGGGESRSNSPLLLHGHPSSSLSSSPSLLFSDSSCPIEHDLGTQATCPFPACGKAMLWRRICATVFKLVPLPTHRVRRRGDPDVTKRVKTLNNRHKDWV